MDTWTSVLVGRPRQRRMQIIKAVYDLFPPKAVLGPCFSMGTKGESTRIFLRFPGRVGNGRRDRGIKGGFRDKTDPT